MKTAHKIITGILIFTALGFTTYQLSQEDQLIIGTWIEESTTIENRWVFESNNIINRYDNNTVYKSYIWQITESPTPSGLIISHLILTNTEDSNDTYHFEINTLSDEWLVLVYQRPGGGIGKLTTYIRQ